MIPIDGTAQMLSANHKPDLADAPHGGHCEQLQVPSVEPALGAKHPRKGGRASEPVSLTGADRSEPARKR
jgi:hypothetical protein